MERRTKWSSGKRSSIRRAASRPFRPVTSAMCHIAAAAQPLRDDATLALPRSRPRHAFASPRRFISRQSTQVLAACPDHRPRLFPGIPVALVIRGVRTLVSCGPATAMECPSVNARKIMDVVRQSADANLGRALLRLARLAEAAHRFEAADLAGRGHDDARRFADASEGSGRIASSDARDASVHGCKDAVVQHQARRSSSVCTEVNR